MSVTVAPGVIRVAKAGVDRWPGGVAYTAADLMLYVFNHGPEATRRYCLDGECIVYDAETESVYLVTSADAWREFKEVEHRCLM